jgi:hypothetical protein
MLLCRRAGMSGEIRAEYLGWQADFRGQFMQHQGIGDAPPLSRAIGYR